MKEIVNQFLNVVPATPKDNKGVQIVRIIREISDKIEAIEGGDWRSKIDEILKEVEKKYIPVAVEAISDPCLDS